MLKRRLALAPRRHYVYLEFSRRKIPRSSAARWQPGKAAQFRSLYDIGEIKQSGSGIQTMIGIGLKS